MEALAKAATALSEAAEAIIKKSTTSGLPGWLAIVLLTIVANTLITIYLYPSQRPDYWWFPGAWIVFLIYDYIWSPIRNWLYPSEDPNSKDPNKRRKFFAPPRIA